MEGRLDAGERRFVSPGLALDLSAEKLSQLRGLERVTMGIRPEHVTLSLAEIAGSNPAKVYVSEALGNETFAFLDLGQQKIVVRTDSAVQLLIESKVWVSFDRAKLHFFDCATGHRIE